jgi:putative membrane protein
VSPLTATSALTTWRIEPVALLVCVGLALAYIRGVSRLTTGGPGAGSHDVRWPVRRTLAFLGLGLGSWLLVTQGALTAYSPDLRWAFALQVMLLLLVVPALIAAGRPLHLVRDLAERRERDGEAPGRLAAIVRSRALAALAHPAVGPLLLLALLLTFLTPMPGEVRQNAVALAVAQVLLPLVGLLTVLPLAGAGRSPTSAVMAVALLLAFLELVLDAVPGILLRLHPSVIGPIQGVQLLSPLRDQQLAGDVLWFVGEAVDIPLLAVLVLAWIRSDEREAAALDAQLDEGPELTEPWWVTEQRARATEPD